MHKHLVALLTILALTACAEVQPLRELERAAPGSARMYVLRPAFSDVGRNESPTLYINDREATRLEYKSYSGFTLKPGTYRLSVKPQQSESDIWTGEWQMSIESDQTYFLAIWNDVEYRQEVRALYFPIPMPYVVTEGSNKSLRHELVPEQEALPVIRSMRFVRPIKEDHAPHP